MGLTYLQIAIGNPAAPDRTKPVESLIDSGADYSVVQTAVLERLGIGRLSEQEFRLADGTRIRRSKGIALFRYEGMVGERA